MSFLDALGLSTFWGKVKSYLSQNVMAPINIFPGSRIDNLTQYTEINGSLTGGKSKAITPYIALGCDHTLSNLNITPTARSIRIEADLSDTSSMQLYIRSIYGNCLPSPATYTLMFTIQNNTASTVTFRTAISTNATVSSIKKDIPTDITPGKTAKVYAVYNYTQDGGARDFYMKLLANIQTNDHIDITFKDFAVYPGEFIIPPTNTSLPVLTSILGSQWQTVDSNNPRRIFGGNSVAEGAYRRLIGFYGIVTGSDTRKIMPCAMDFVVHASATARALSWDTTYIKIRTANANAQAKSFISMTAERTANTGVLKYRLALDPATNIVYLEQHVSYGSGSGVTYTTYAYFYNYGITRPTRALEQVENVSASEIVLAEVTPTVIGTDITSILNPSS